MTYKDVIKEVEEIAAQQGNDAIISSIETTHEHLLVGAVAHGLDAGDIIQTIESSKNPEVQLAEVLKQKISDNISEY